MHVGFFDSFGRGCVWEAVVPSVSSSRSEGLIVNLVLGAQYGIMFTDNFFLLLTLCAVFIWPIPISPGFHTTLLVYRRNTYGTLFGFDCVER